MARYLRWVNRHRRYVWKELEEIENKLKKTSKNNFIIQNFKIRYTSRNNNSSIPKIVEKKI